MKIGRWWIVALLVVGVVRANGETIEFAEDELATESVLPKFDQPTATKKRVVPTAKRFEIDVQAGTSLADAFFTTVPVGLMAGYHFNEFSAVQVRGDYYLNSVTSYKQQIIADTPGADVRLNKNPAAKYSFGIGYEMTPFYGKISVTKQRVINLATILALDFGLITFEDASSPYGSIDLGQKFFFSPNWGLRLDLKTVFYNQTDVIYDPVEKRLMTNVIFSLGAVFLLPSL